MAAVGGVAVGRPAVGTLIKESATAAVNGTALLVPLAPDSATKLNGGSCTSSPLMRGLLPPAATPSGLGKGTKLRPLPVLMPLCAVPLCQKPVCAMPLTAAPSSSPALAAAAKVMDTSTGTPGAVAATAAGVGDGRSTDSVGSNGRDGGPAGPVVGSTVQDPIVAGADHAAAGAAVGAVKAGCVAAEAQVMELGAMTGATGAGAAYETGAATGAGAA